MLELCWMMIYWMVITRPSLDSIIHSLIILKFVLNNFCRLFFFLNFPKALKRCMDPPLAGYAQCAFSSSPSASSQQMKMGTMQMAFFDKTTEKCSWFIFLGCGGSKNQFASLEVCRETCELSSPIKQIRESKSFTLYHFIFCATYLSTGSLERLRI